MGRWIFCVGLLGWACADSVEESATDARVGPECTDGERRCLRSVVQLCRDSEWLRLSECPAETACMFGECVALADAALPDAAPEVLDADVPDLSEPDVPMDVAVPDAALDGPAVDPDVPVRMPDLGPDADPDPDVPDMDPDVPDMEPDSGLDPDVPDMDPDVPDMDPDVPDMDPDVPDVDPDVLDADPDIPNPDARDMDPDVPDAGPDVPDMAPDVRDASEADVAQVDECRKAEDDCAAREQCVDAPEGLRCEPCPVPLVGDFQGPSRIVGGIFRLAVTDVNRDGRDDLITSTQRSIAWHAGRAVGGFEAPQPVGGGMVDIRSILVGDVDDDGLIDVVALDFGDVRARPLERRVNWFRNLGDAGFAEAQVIPTDNGLGWIALDDPDEDGDLDLLAGGQGTHLHRNTPAGFVDEGPVVEQSGPTVVADLTGDGTNDLLISTVYYPGVPGPENYGGQQRISAGPVIWNFAELAVADLDGDGDHDMAISNAAGVFWMQREGLPLGECLPLEPANNATAMAVGDIDGDGDADLFATTQGNVNGNVSDLWIRNDGDGEFTTFRFGNRVQSSARYAAAGDFDGDGDLDYVTLAPFDSNRVYLYRNELFCPR